MMNSIVYAQNITIDQPAGFQITDVGTIVSGAIGIAFIVAGLIIFAFLVIGGFLYITSSGDKSQAEKGSQAVTGAMIGFAIVAAAWAIMKLVEYFFGVSFTGSLTLPSLY